MQPRFRNTGLTPSGLSGHMWVSRLLEQKWGSASQGMVCGCLTSGSPGDLVKHAHPWVLRREILIQDFWGMALGLAHLTASCPSGSDTQWRLRPSRIGCGQSLKLVLIKVTVKKQTNKQTKELREMQRQAQETQGWDCIIPEHSRHLEGDVRGLQARPVGDRAQDYGWCL